MKTYANWNNEGAVKYLVVWTEYVGNPDERNCTTTDHYEAFESLDEANSKIAHLRNDEDIYSYHLCAVQDSSDYPAHPSLTGFDRQLNKTRHCGE
jgi:hypothetical protein